MNRKPIAIIGISCLFPDSSGLKAYWRLLYHKRDAIRDIPKTHWSLDDYFHEDPKTPDHVYCRRGAFLSPIDFDPSEFGIPPSSLETTDTSQILSLITVKNALEDAGYGQAVDFNRDKTSVILGVTGTQELAIPLGARLGHPIWRRALEASGVSNDTTESVIQKISDSYVPWKENSFPGLLGNVVAGRVCNRLNLGGTNCVVDAACASSFSALHLALLELQSNHSDMVVTGGVDTINDIFMHMCFSKTYILSPTGDIRPFSDKADGTVLGEGVGIIVLKRLEDAERDGDRIYAVIKGLGASSDGKSQSIYAPRKEGQVKAIQTAYQYAQIDPATVGMIEAHGTGTKIGDKVEISALKEIFGQNGHRLNYCALGSVKSMIGHTKAAAGSAGIIKSVLALANKVLPPTLKADPQDPDLNIHDSPFYINSETRPWISDPDAPRRSGVSAFGFGGSNFHVVLEEYAKDKKEISWNGAVEIFALSADSLSELRKQSADLAALVKDGITLDDRARLAEKSRRKFSSTHRFRLTMVHDLSKTDDDASASLKQLVQQAAPALEAGRHETAWRQENIYFGKDRPPGGLAFLFPGQGSQYVNMGRDLACMFPEVLALIEKANARFDGAGSLANAIFPIPAKDSDHKRLQDKILRRTDMAQPAIGAFSLGMFRVIERFNAIPDAVCGHSFGELTALASAGWMDDDTFLDLAVARGNAMAAAAERNGNGAMLAVKAPLATLMDFAAEIPDLTLANLNAPDQGVLSGSIRGISEAKKILSEKGFRSISLPVSAAFHSEWIDGAQKPFQSALEKSRITPTNIPVYSNSTGKPFPKEIAEFKTILGLQILKPVYFKDVVEHLYERNIRIFVEVGPKSVLTGLVRSILKEKEYAAVALDASAGKAFGAADLARVLSLMASLGEPVNLHAWEDPAPPEKEYRMKIQVRGANFRNTITEADQHASPAADTPSGEKKHLSFEVQEPFHEKRMMHDRNVHNKPETTNDKTMKKPYSQPLPDVIEKALKTIQEGLKSMQALQAQTTEAHKKFLEAQSASSNALQQMMEGAQRMVETSMGIPHRSSLPDGGMKSIGSAAEPLQTSDVIAVSTEPQQGEISINVEDTQPAYIEAASRSVQADSTPAIKTEPTPDGSTATITSTLLTIVSELTGYPKDMLDMDMDIESDLGIDSIKRVEILSTLEETIPGLPTISPDMMGSLKTLGQITAFLAGESAPNVDPQSIDVRNDTHPPLVSASEKSSATHVEIQSVLIEIVSDLTGYPKEMLGMDMDIEADLGIDSIKRVEIMSTVEEKMPDLPSVSPEMLGSLKTLGLICDYLASGYPTDAGADICETIPSSESSQASTGVDFNSMIHVSTPTNGIERRIVSIDDSPLSHGDIMTLPSDGCIYVFGDASDLSDALMRAFNDHGIRASWISMKEAPSFLKNQRKKADAAGLIIVSDSREEKGRDLFLKRSFRLAKHFAPTLSQCAEKSNAVFATVTRLDGAFGFKGKRISDPTSGGLAGLAKTAAIEWEGIHCRALDIDPDWRDLRAAAEKIAREILSTDPAGSLEIGFDKDHRYTLSLQSRPYTGDSSGPIDLDPDDIIIISGGARGITAAAAAELAKTVPAKFVLIGRSPAPFKKPEWLNGLESAADIKKAILENEFNNNGASLKDIEKSYRRHTANREIIDTIEKIEAFGASVRYYPADITDRDAIESVLKNVRESFGPARAVIHGAGVIQDRLIIDKTMDQFQRVYDTKVAGIRTLLKATESDPLKYIVLFSSVAGRFGNQGQADYAMANEVLNKIAHQEAFKRKDCRVLSINWGPWDGGMVTTALKREFGKNRIALIPVEAGVQCLLHEMGQEAPPLLKSLSVHPCPPVTSTFQPLIRCSRLKPKAEWIACRLPSSGKSIRKHIRSSHRMFWTANPWFRLPL